jgi:hypothetical protein
MPKFKDSQVLRGQIVNIIEDLVEGIVPGYLSPNSFSRFDYSTEIYKHVYKKLWREFGRKRSEYADYRDEVSDFLREVPSEDFFTATEHLLKVVCRIVYIQRTIPDDILPNPNAGNQLWNRKESVRNWHIKLFKDSVDDINDRILKNNSKCLYTLEGEFVQLVRLGTGLEVPEGESGIQETDDKQNSELQQKKKESDILETDDKHPPKLHQNQSRSEFWYKRNYRIAVIVAILTAAAVILTGLSLLFGDNILIRLWNHLPTIKESIAGWFR